MTNRDPDHMTRFYGNRIMIELTLGRRLTVKEQRRLFGISNKKTEREIFGSALEVDITEFRLK